ncbi:hypothetical protein D3C80_1819080 [compost metagenome]
MVFVRNDTMVCSARSQLMLGMPSGLSGSQAWVMKIVQTASASSRLLSRKAPA